MSRSQREIHPKRQATVEHINHAWLDGIEKLDISEIGHAPHLCAFCEEPMHRDQTTAPDGSKMHGKCLSDLLAMDPTAFVDTAYSVYDDGFGA